MLRPEGFPSLYFYCDSTADAHVIMPAMQLRASTKFIKLGYVFCLMIALGIAVYLKSTGPADVRYWWVLIVPGLLMIILLMRHIKRRLIKLDIVGDRVRYESGFLSKMTRTEEVMKLQDVCRCTRRWGNASSVWATCHSETAGGSSRIVMRFSIDRPQLAADHILEIGKNAEAAARRGTRHIACNLKLPRLIVVPFLEVLCEIPRSSKPN